jgi:hypothetical protein
MPPVRSLVLVRHFMMIIGALTFIVFGGAVVMEAGNKDAASDTRNPQPELRATALFSR